jgi:hypothetical protein
MATCYCCIIFCLVLLKLMLSHFLDLKVPFSFESTYFYFSECINNFVVNICAISITFPLHLFMQFLGFLKIWNIQNISITTSLFRLVELIELNFYFSDCINIFVVYVCASSISAILLIFVLDDITFSSGKYTTRHA